MGLFNLKSPQSMIKVMLFVYLALQIVVLLGPLILTSFVNISQISGFALPTLFQAGGFMAIVFTFGLVVAVLAVLGMGGKK